MKILSLVVVGCAMLLACSQSKPGPEVAAVETKPGPIEIGDAQYAGIAKQSLKDLAEGNVDGFLSAYSDDARFYWNYGDSVIGKPAIAEYWKTRRENSIDTLTYTRDLWVTVNANESQIGLETGTHVLAWYYATATYKATGKSMSQWIHQVHHFDTNGKIDQIRQYADRLLIREATTKK